MSQFKASPASMTLTFHLSMNDFFTVYIILLKLFWRLFTWKLLWEQVLVICLEPKEIWTYFAKTRLIEDALQNLDNKEKIRKLKTSNKILNKFFSKLELSRIKETQGSLKNEILEKITQISFGRS